MEGTTFSERVGCLMRPALGEHFCQSPIHHVDRTEGAYHDVAGFHVAVDDVLAVSKRQRVANLDEYFERPRFRPSGFPGTHTTEEHTEVLSLNEPHGEVGFPLIRDSQFVNGDEPRVVQLSSDLCFVEKPSYTVFGPGSLRFEGYLHGDRTAQVLVEDLVDGAHSSSCQLPVMLIPTSMTGPGAQSLQTRVQGVAHGGPGGPLVWNAVVRRS